VIRRAALLSLALAGLAAAVRAHDFWIEPSSFHPALGSELAVSLRVGQDFRGNPVPRNPKLLRSFVLVSSAGQTPVGGLPGADPAGSVRIADPGILWIEYRSGSSPVTLEAEKFEKYLAEEGLDTILEARKKRRDSGKPGREVFSRSVKSMLVAGPSAHTPQGFDRVLGLTLEIVPETDPTRLGPEGSLPVRVIHDGRPLPGVLLVAMNQAEPEKKLTARSDGKGRATLRLPRKGVWLIKAVHMHAAPAGVDADWESVWTSMTFEVP
jgi:uncharacterized GH25 family protein